MRLLSRICALAGALALSACGSEAIEARYIDAGNPALLSQWGQVGIRDGALVLGEDVVAYDMNTALFTDYAHKLRTIWMPEGLSAEYREGEVFDFPVGTVITKTFYYPRAEADVSERVARTEDETHDFANGAMPLENVRLIETRILVHREDGWVAIPYLWNDEQTEAEVHRIGEIIPLTLVDASGGEEAFNYVMPNVNQCASCHAPDSNTRIISPIGPKARHINRGFAYAGGSQNQIARLGEAGFLTGAPDDLSAAPQNAAWADPDAAMVDRARAYLDVNCAHCHSPVGPADTSGLFLEPWTEFGPSLGICKLPIAAGSGTGNRSFGIVPGDPDNSILHYRMDSIAPDVMMPELGRSTIHREGVELVAEWIRSLEGDCAG